MTNKSIDRELVHSIDLEIIASDNRPIHVPQSFKPVEMNEQSGVAKSRLPIHLQITDINDNVPRFVMTASTGSASSSSSSGETTEQSGVSGGDQVISLEFDEGLPANSRLLTLKAQDLDADANAQIRYELVVDDTDTDDIERTFRLDTIKGELFLRRKLELTAGRAKKLWQLSVRARDVASGKYALALVNLKLNDVNNHAPEVALTFFLVPRYPKLHIA